MRPADLTFATHSAGGIAGSMVRQAMAPRDERRVVMHPTHFQHAMDCKLDPTKAMNRPIS